jgi:hypothetical protein
MRCERRCDASDALFRTVKILDAFLANGPLNARLAHEVEQLVLGGTCGVSNDTSAASTSIAIPIAVSATVRPSMERALTRNSQPGRRGPLGSALPLVTFTGRASVRGGSTPPGATRRESPAPCATTMTPGSG